MCQGYRTFAPQVIRIMMSGRIATCDISACCVRQGEGWWEGQAQELSQKPQQESRQGPQAQQAWR